MAPNESDFLDDMTKADAAETPEEPETEAAEKVEKGESDKPDGEQPKVEDEKKSEATPATDPKEIAGLKSGLKAEREKRQKAERELAEFMRQQQEHATQPQQTFYESPEHYIASVAQQAEAQANNRLMAALDAQARDTYPDYDEVLEYLTEQSRENPAFAQQVFKSPNPAVAAYRLGKQLRETERMQDPDAYRAQIRAEARAEWEAEQKAKDDARAKAAAEIPPDLAAARNATADTQARPGAVFSNLFPE